MSHGSLQRDGKTLETSKSTLVTPQLQQGHTSQYSHQLGTKYSDIRAYGGCSHSNHQSGPWKHRNHFIVEIELRFLCICNRNLKLISSDSLSRDPPGCLCVALSSSAWSPQQLQHGALDDRLVPSVPCRRFGPPRQGCVVMGHLGGGYREGSELRCTYRW